MKIKTIALVAALVAQPAAVFAYGGSTGIPDGGSELPRLQGIEKIDPVEVRRFWGCVFSLGANCKAKEE
jgi:hypothetical protein